MNDIYCNCCMLSAFDTVGPDGSAGCDDVTHGCPAGRAAATGSDAVLFYLYRYLYYMHLAASSANRLRPFFAPNYLHTCCEAT